MATSATIVFSQPFTISDRLENRWRWTPASGAADHYIIEKYVVNQWSTYGQVPATTEPDGFVYATIISPDVEIYKIRVIAVDAAGNQGMPSPENEIEPEYQGYLLDGKLFATSEEEFIAQLTSIFRTSKTQKVIGTLLAMSRQEGNVNEGE